MVVVVDTNILWDTAALARLRDCAQPAVLPAVALAERARQLLIQGRALDELWGTLHQAGIDVVPMMRDQAIRCGELRVPDNLWSRHARDAMIAGHVGPDDVLWTKNPKDFLAVGLPPERILAC